MSIKKWFTFMSYEQMQCEYANLVLEALASCDENDRKRLKKLLVDTF